MSARILLLVMAVATVACGGPELPMDRAIAACVKDATQKSNDCIDFCRLKVRRPFRDQCSQDCSDQHMRRLDWCGLE